VKAIALLSFFVIVLFSAAVLAQLQYSVNTVLNEKGRSFVKLMITFPGPEETFNFTIKGNVENFNASSNAGPVSCELKNGLITPVHCSLNLTENKRTVYIDYETSSFVKISDRYFFDGDFSLNREIGTIAVSITLPEGMTPAKDIEGIFPSNATMIWNPQGGKVNLIWSLNDIPADRILRFQILYEKLQTSGFQLWYIVFPVIAIVTIIIVILIKKMRGKSKEIVLSVLDEFERKVMDSIIASGGTVNQRKVVQETNLSKAKVSRVVKSLEERGLIEVERLGRTNKLKARKKVLE